MRPVQVRTIAYLSLTTTKKEEMTNEDAHLPMTATPVPKWCLVIANKDHPRVATFISTKLYQYRSPFEITRFDFIYVISGKGQSYIAVFISRSATCPEVRLKSLGSRRLLCGVFGRRAGLWIFKATHSHQSAITACMNGRGDGERRLLKLILIIYMLFPWWSNFTKEKKKTHVGAYRPFNATCINWVQSN